MKYVIFVLILIIGLGNTEASPKTIRKAIVYILTEGVPSHGIKPYKKHPLLKNRNELVSLSRAIHLASKKHHVSSMLLVAIAFRESSFRLDRVGKIGERSAFQMTVETTRLAHRWDKQCSLDTHKGSALCAAVWLKRWKKKCGDWKGAVTIYATGKTCKPKSKKVKWLTKDRIGLARKLERKFY